MISDSLGSLFGYDRQEVPHTWSGVQHNPTDCPCCARKMRAAQNEVLYRLSYAQGMANAKYLAEKHRINRANEKTGVLYDDVQ